MRSPSVFPILCGFTAALLAVAPAASAQTDSAGLTELRPGAKVRVTAPAVSPDRLTRVVADVRPDTIVLAPDHVGTGYVTIPVDAVTRLEINRGKPGRTALTAAGALAGFIGGMAVASNLNPSEPCNGSFSCVSDIYREAMESTLITVGGALVGTLVGGVVGYALGSAIFPDSWSDVPPGAIRVSIAPHRSGASVAVAVAF